MSVISATIFLPMRSPVSTISSARNTASSSFFMNAPGAGLHVQHQPIDSLRQFLAHDRRANQKRALHRPVTSRSA